MSMETETKGLCPGCKIGEYQSCPFAAKVVEYDVSFYIGELTQDQRDELIGNMISQAQARGCTRLE